MQTEQRRSKMSALWKGAICFIAAAVLLLTSGVAFAATDLDQNQEVQWVMGDLSALKTAAQAYYSDHNDPQVPPLSGILNYFDPGSLPPNASTLYILRGDSRGWYVGYQAIGLQNETYRLLQSNAGTLGLLGDDLRTPWRFGDRYFWTEALALSPTAGSATTTTTTTTVIKRDSGLSDVTGLILATAALVNIIADNDHDHYYYYVPGHNWYWYSGLTYRPVYYNRFFRYYYRPLPVPPPRFYPVPRYRFRVPRAGWLAPDWRHRYEDAHRFYNPRYAHDWRLDNHYADRRWRDESRRVPLAPPPPPPPRGRIGPPPPPDFRRLPPPRGRGPRPGDDHFRPVPPPPPRPDDRRAPDGHRPPPRPPRPDGHSSPEFRRPPRRPDGHFSPEFRRPEPHGREEGFRPSPGRQAPPPPKRPGNRPAPEMRRPTPPQEHPKRPSSPEQRRPAPPQRRPNDRNAPQIRRPEQSPRPGNDRNRQNIRPPQQQRRPDSGRSPRQENRRPQPPRGRSEHGQPRR